MPEVDYGASWEPLGAHYQPLQASRSSFSTPFDAFWRIFDAFWRMFDAFWRIFDAFWRIFDAFCGQSAQKRREKNAVGHVACMPGIACFVNQPLSIPDKFAVVWGCWGVLGTVWDV